MLELQRDLVYVGAAAAFLLLWRSDQRAQLLWGVCGGILIVALYALGGYLATRPAFDATQGYLLFSPVGYANTLGGLVAIGLPLLLGLAVHDHRHAVTRFAAPATVVLAVALYLTQNRSGYLALGVALGVWLWRTNDRTGAATALLVLGIPAGAGVAVIWLADVLDTHRQISDLSTRRTVAGAVVVGIALLVSAVAPRMRRLSLPRGLLVQLPRAAAAIAGTALFLVLLRPGERARYWSVAWRAFERHPLLGSGAGTFDEQWMRHRGGVLFVRDAHSLYLETLSELGAVGLVLLALLLAWPLLAGRRNRDPLLAACAAAYCGSLVHAGFEWDWEMPVMIVAALALGCVLVQSRDPGRPVSIPRGARFIGAATAALLAAFTVLAYVGGADTVRAERRIALGDLQGAAASANRATRLLPWASEPWIVIADVLDRQGDQVGARAALRAAIARDGADWALWLRLAAVSHGSARVLALRRALELNPRLVSRAGAGS
jgi:hypothetical protein